MKRKNNKPETNDTPTWEMHTIVIGGCVKCDMMDARHRLLMNVYAVTLCDRCVNDFTQFFTLTDAMKQWQAIETAYRIAIEAKDAVAASEAQQQLRTHISGAVMNAAAEWCSHKRTGEIIN